MLKLTRFTPNLIPSVGLLCVFVLIGCGYRLQGSGTILPADIKTIAVSSVDNDTTEPGLGLELEEALRTTFDGYGVLKVVEPGSSADIVLKTRILDVDTQVKSVTGATDRALEYDLVMTISAELRRKNGQVLYANPKLKASESFASTSNVVVTSSSNFAQGGIGSASLQGLETNELSRGQQQSALNDLIEEVSRILYLDAVAADF
jgi:outer membrane lipopolysaccharide assembly protein LptE/RlpB